MPLVRAQYPGAQLVFIDDGQAPGRVNGHDIIDWNSFLERDTPVKSVSIAIAASTIRQILARKCEDA